MLEMDHKWVEYRSIKANWIKIGPKKRPKMDPKSKLEENVIKKTKISL